MSKSYDVVAVGHALVDIRIVVDRFPGPDEEARVLDQTWGGGGSAVNMAIDAKRLGLRSSVIAKIGFDSFGRIIVDELLREGVDISGLRISVGKTGFTIVVIDKNGSITMYGYKGVAEDLEPGDIDLDIISNSRYVHIASLRIDTSIHVAEIARKNNSKVLWDPGRVLAGKGIDALSKLIEKVDIVLLNNLEAKMLTNLDDHREAAKIIKSLGPELVIVKRGSKGVYALGYGLDEEIPAMNIDRVVDTTGAGDAFAAGLIAGMIRGYTIKKAILYANAVAALKITKLGSHEAPTHEEVVNFIWEKGLAI
ncbi:cytidine kinase; inosine-guanosine kinase; 6-phosphofructokinase [Ignisphaera aggregans DSM 17230]|uniref:Cytidine kinase inosine-guanosine kinase 6-phosphofructokinase n=1 Tax=Ignisphaera aggregans (strain DSM 17230 / JCM 13409 / AQ1.S1) TaxID=583356 RepID=E0SRH6_IGNAA|nr:cytidine kinase; inosine-guanosine kinase; 6-phosphofructokinase [Ignisphaera aggregans DSM 17230]